MPLASKIRITAYWCTPAPKRPALALMIGFDRIRIDFFFWPRARIDQPYSALHKASKACRANTPRPSRLEHPHGDPAAAG